MARALQTNWALPSASYSCTLTDAAEEGQESLEIGLSTDHQHIVMVGAGDGIPRLLLCAERIVHRTPQLYRNDIVAVAVHHECRNTHGPHAIIQLKARPQQPMYG